MRSAISGDSAAYHRLLKSVTPVLRAAARRGLARAGRPADQSEDIVQDILLAVHLKRHTWDANAPVAAARRAAVDRGRQRVDQGYRGQIRHERGGGAGGAASRACQPHRQITGTMRMDTDQLIRSLAADNSHRARPVGFVLMLALLAAG